MDKNRKTSHILNVFQYDDATGAVTLPSTLSLTAPASNDSSSKVGTTAWVRTYVTGLNYLTAGSTSTSDISEGTNLYYTTNRFDTRLAAKTTSDLAEGTNLYYTAARFNTAFGTKSTTDLTEGTNLYYTAARFNTAFSGKSTTDLTEGTNLYFTPTRARTSISVTGSGSYDSATGIITVTGGVTSVNTKTGDVTLTTSDITEGTRLYYTDTRVGTYLTTNNYATQSYVSTQIANLIDSAPGTLDTLNELAAALGDDPNFATTIATSIGTKQAQLNGTGFVKVSGTTVSYDNSTYLTTSSAASSYQPLDADLTAIAALGTTGFLKRTGANTWALDTNTYLTSFTETDPIYVASSWYSTTNNASNWNTAYGWGNHASGGYLTTASAASTYASLTGSYANPSWITSLAYSKITGVPAFLTSYTETDPYRVTAVAVSGTSTKTITLTRADASTVTTTWTDYDTDTNTYASSLGFSGGTLTLTNNNASTVSVSLDGRYLQSYSETDTLATVTSRGAYSSTRTTFVELGVTKAGSDSVAAGPWFRWTNVAEDRQMLAQLNASNGLTYWSYNGSAWVSAFTLSQAGAGTFASSVTASSIIKSGGTSSQFLKADGSVDSNSYITGISSSNVTTALGYTPANSSLFTNLGTQTFSSTTTSAFLTELNSKGAFGSNKFSIMKGSWSYAGNGDLTDTGFGTIELAGSVIQAYSDDSGQYHIWLTRPTTGNGGFKMLVYNNQGSGYSPGWREVITNEVIGSYAPSLTGSGASGTWGINVTGSAGSVPFANLTSSTVSGWMVHGRNGSSAEFYLAHSGGYGMHINTYNQSGSVYGLEVYNNVKDLLIVYNDGRVLVDGANQVLHAGNYSSYSLPLSGAAVMTGSLVNNTDGAVIMESNASENNNWLFKENSKAWGLFWFNRGSQAGQTIGGYTTVGAELMFMGGSSGVAMPSGWTGYYSGSNIAAMISNYNGYIYSASTVYAATSMVVNGNTVLHAGNYTSYTYSTTDADSRFLRGTTSPGSVNNFTISIGNNGSYSYVQSHSGQPLRLNPVGNTIYLDSTTYAGTIYANIIYDSNDSGYYLDANSQSRLYKLNVNSVGNDQNSVMKIAVLDAGYNDNPVTGAIQVRLPRGMTNCMMQFKVKIYNYSDDSSAIYTISGYNYSGGYWVNRATSVEASASFPIRQVRWGRDSSGYATVWIGETNSSWSYLKVAVVDFMGAHSDIDYNTWATGWVISTVTSFYSVDDARYPQNSSYRYYATADMRAPAFYNSDDTSKYLTRNTSSYTSWYMGGNQNGYSGWRVDGGMNLMMHTNGAGGPVGFWHSDYGWSILTYTNGAQNLYYAGSDRFATTSYGVYVTGEIRATSDITAYYSDARLKKDVDIIENAVEKIKQLRGVTYTWNDEEVNVVKKRAGQRDIGLIAQEVEAIEPLLTKEYQTPLDAAPATPEEAANYNPRMSETYKTIKYDKLVALLIEGVKEQQKQIEELKTIIDGLTK